MKYYVRTTGDRELDSSYSQIEYTLLIDKEHKPVESFIDQLELISSEDCVLLEDDCILCNNFKEEIEKVISEHPSDIINFYTNPSNYFTSHYSQSFMFNQCTYYPKGIGKELAIEMKFLFGKYKYCGYDTLEGNAIRNLDLCVYNYRPCLVQHLDGYSLITKSKALNNYRMTPYFKDYLDKYKLDYNNHNEVLKFRNVLKLEVDNLHKKLKDKR